MPVARPYWALLRRWFPPDMCAELAAETGKLGWQKGTYSDGTQRDHVSVRFRQFDESFLMGELGAALADVTESMAGVFGVLVAAEKLRSVQFSLWREGDHYGEHCDHDATGRLAHDRKLTLYLSLTDGGGLGVRDDGVVRCNTGDLMVMTALAQHWAPRQETGERISMVAWIPGPHWR